MKKVFGAVVALGLMLFGASAPAAELDIDLAARHELSVDGVNKAVDEARRHFLTSPNDVVVLKFPAGVFDFSRASADKAIVVSSVQPGPTGRLIFKGAGKDQTTLVFSKEA